MNSHNEKGYSLAEVLAAILLLTVIFLSFMPLYSKSVRFASNNEQVLTKSNEARQVMALMEENRYAINILKANGFLDSNLKLKKSKIDGSVAAELEVIKKLINAENQIQSKHLPDLRKVLLTLKDVSEKDTTKTKDAINIHILTLDKLGKKSTTTYALLEKKNPTQTINLKDVPTPTNPGRMFIDALYPTAFETPIEPGVAVRMRHDPCGSCYPKGHSTFIQIYERVNQYTIKLDAKLENGVGGYGILLDGALKKLPSGYYEDSGFMFEYVSTGFAIKKRENGSTSNTPIQSYTLAELGLPSTFSLGTRHTVEITARDADPNAVPKTDGTHTIRTYTFVITTEDGTKSVPKTFSDPFLRTKNVQGYNANNKYTGIRIWNNDTTNSSILKIYDL